MTDVVGEVGQHIVPTGMAVRIAGKGEAAKTVVPHRRGQLERIPTLTPRGRRLLSRFKDHEVARPLREEVADRQPGLTTTDHHHLTPLNRQAVGRILVARLLGHVRRLPPSRFPFSAPEEVGRAQIDRRGDTGALAPASPNLALLAPARQVTCLPGRSAVLARMRPAIRRRVDRSRRALRRPPRASAQSRPASRRRRRCGTRRRSGCGGADARPRGITRGVGTVAEASAQAASRSSRHRAATSGSRSTWEALWVPTNTASWAAAWKAKAPMKPVCPTSSTPSTVLLPIPAP